MPRRACQHAKKSPFVCIVSYSSRVFSKNKHYTLIIDRSSFVNVFVVTHIYGPRSRTLKIFLIFILIILEPLSASNNFYAQSSRLSMIQVNSFSRIGTKIWNEMPVSLRKLSKNAFKRKIKQTLFEILASEDCFIDLPEIVQKVKLNLFPS